jgi:hypothetical protein
MAGLGPAIYVSAPREDVDARHKAGHDEIKTAVSAGMSRADRRIGGGAL